MFAIISPLSCPSSSFTTPLDHPHKCLQISPTFHLACSHSPKLCHTYRQYTLLPQTFNMTVTIISRPTGTADEESKYPTITGFKPVASYNWLDVPSPTILVPGQLAYKYRSITLLTHGNQIKDILLFGLHPLTLQLLPPTTQASATSTKTQIATPNAPSVLSSRQSNTFSPTTLSLRSTSSVIVPRCASSMLLPPVNPTLKISDSG